MSSGGGESEQAASNNSGVDAPTTTTTTTTTTTQSSSSAFIDSSSSSSNSNSASGGGEWWKSMLQVAKEKSKSAFDMIRTDLIEYQSTMATDTTHILEKASVQLKETTHQALSRIDSLHLGSLMAATDGSGEKLAGHLSSSSGQQSRRLASSGNTSSSSSSNYSSSVGGSTTSIEARYKQELDALRNAEATYQSDPTPTLASATFADWSATFDANAYKAQISDLLIENGAVRVLYAQLVPAHMSNTQFWARYFFRLALLDEEHKKRVKLLERAVSAYNSSGRPADAKADEDASFDWDEKDDETTSSATVTATTAPADAAPKGDSTAAATKTEDSWFRSLHFSTHNIFNTPI